MIFSFDWVGWAGNGPGGSQGGPVVFFVCGGGGVYVVSFVLIHLDLFLNG